jgi:hypothetical protein
MAIIAALIAAGAWAAEYRAPLMAQAPKIDGNIEPAEWAAAAGFSGFVWQGALERRRGMAYVGATATTLYMAIKTQLPEEGQILAQVNQDTAKLVFDDSVEVWIDPTPGAAHGKTYQMLANAIGHAGYQVHARGNAAADPAWRGNWQMESGFHEGYWHYEIAVPIAGIAPGRTADHGSWGINLCRNWKEPWAFSSLGGGGYAPTDMTFTFAADDAPAVAHEVHGDPHAGAYDMALRLSNPGRAAVAVQAQMLLKRDVMPELKAAEALTIGPGETKQLTLAAKDDPTRKYDLTIRVASADGKKVYYERAYAWQKGEPWKWTVAKKQVLPIDIQFAYYPYLNKMKILADVTNLPEGSKLDNLTCAIRPRGGGQAIKTVVFDKFVKGRQEMVFDLPPLKGSYEIAAVAHGNPAPAGEVVKPFERTVYPWEHLGLGTSKKVYAPFTPIKVAGMKLSTVLREHTMNNEGLWEQVVATEKALLAAPMRFAATVGGAEQKVQAAKLRFTKAEGDEAVAQTGLQAGALKAQVQCKWDYDGTMRVDMTLQPTGGKTVDALTLEIPMKDAGAPLIHALGDGIRNGTYLRLPEGEGVVWTAEKAAVNDFPRNFCSYIYVGSAVRGLCWFCENDRGWSWDSKTPNLELVRKGGVLTLRVHLINKPVAIEAPRTITFGLLAAPVKPRVSPWRYRWRRDNYSLLGTDINWFALGNCGSVYPAGKDMYLWEMLAKGNVEHLTDAQVEEVIEHGKKYYAPYPDWLQTFIVHVRYNLRARFGTKMVFYYNRSSYQAADEFQTFQDEWDQSDCRTVGPGNGIGEIGIVPSASHIDYSLYWYGKSFDLGRNQGVYWDNWFFACTFNTMMTAAYKREDGTMMPSNGIWGLRELSKRTFQYENERGMLPITMPHMTSTNILPMHSFATVQYDWEWKYSEGDVQYRFPREYILLVTNGQLAGTWPVLLGDQGKLAEDPWTCRTFAAVAMVHELDGQYPPWAKTGQQQLALFKPIDEMVDKPGVEVYRYWDDRPQPVVADNKDLPTIVYAVKGIEAVVAVVSYVDGDATATLAIDPVALGFPKGYRVVDIERGEQQTVTGDKMNLAIKKHDIREFRILPEAG